MFTGRNTFWRLRPLVDHVFREYIHFSPNAATAFSLFFAWNGMFRSAFPPLYWFSKV
jgi:hypothetical protein